MPQIVDKHYNDFGGLDTTTNALKMQPTTQRRGSKNWRYNDNDQYAQRYGFQHKSENITGFEYGITEYKYRDINTGLAKTEILGVGSDGYLYKRRSDRLKLVRNGGNVNSYSVFYDEVNNLWRFQLKNTAGTLLMDLIFLDTYPLNDLVTDINAAAVTGITASVVDENDVVISSTRPAYLLQTTINEVFNTVGVDTEYNDLWYSEKISSPGGGALYPEVTNSDVTNLPDFEGLTSTNLYNSNYSTCGGFPIKYDGYTAYRMGIPQIQGHQATSAGVPSQYGLSNNSGFSVANNTVASGSNLTAGDYFYNFRITFRDASGAITYGKWNEEAQVKITLANNSVLMTLGAVKYDKNFPVYSAVVHADSTDTATSIQVKKNHNLLSGMTIRFQYYSASPGPSTVPADSWKRISYQQPVFWYSRITSIDTSNVGYDVINLANALHREVVDVPVAGTVVRTSKVKAGMIINAYFAEDQWSGHLSSTIDGINIYNQTIIGAAIEVYRKQVTTSDWNLAWILPISYDPTVTNEFIDDDQTITAVAPDTTLGEEIPRACRYIGQWQQQLVQGGRPYDTSLKDDNYPTAYQKYAVQAFGATGPEIEGTYTEASLCDYQSVYWTDPLTPEGFPRSGLTEEDFQGEFSDQIRGFHENKESLFVFKDRTVGLITGTVATNDLQKEILETDAGCSSFNSIQDVAGSLVWCDAVGGFWSCVAGRLPEYVGKNIQNDFRKNMQVPREQRLLPWRAKSTNYRLDNQYICFIPAGWIEDGETQANPNPTQFSLMFVFDYSATETNKRRNCWYQWQDAYPNAGILATAQDELIFSENRNSDARLWKQKRTGTRFDMTDHKSAIEMNIKSAWLNYGAPTIDKDFVNCWINSILGNFTLRIDQYYNYNEALQSSFNLEMPENNPITIKQNANLNIPKISALSLGMYNNEKNRLVAVDGFEIVYAADYDLGEPKK